MRRTGAARRRPVVPMMADHLPGRLMRRILAIFIAILLATTPTLVVAQSVDATSDATLAAEGAAADTTDAEGDATESMAPVLTDAPERRDGKGDEIAIGVIAGSCFVAGAAFLVVASNRRDDLDRVEGTTLYADEQRRIYQQQDEGNRLLGYSLIGVGLLASAGLAVLIHNDGPELSVAPTANRRGGGFAFGARF